MKYLAFMDWTRKLNPRIVFVLIQKLMAIIKFYSQENVRITPINH